MPADVSILKGIIPDDLLAQVEAAVKDRDKFTLVNGADGSYVPKAKFDEEHTTAKTYKDQAADYKAKLDTAVASAGDSEAMKGQLATLQKQLTDNEAAHTAALLGFRVKDAVRGHKVHDADVIMPLLKMDTIKEDAKNPGKFTGLDEQIKELRTSKPFLFSDAPDDKGGAQQTGAKGAEGTNKQVNDAIRNAWGGSNAGGV